MRFFISAALDSILPRIERRPLLLEHDRHDAVDHGLLGNVVLLHRRDKENDLPLQVLGRDGVVLHPTPPSSSTTATPPAAASRAAAAPVVAPRDPPRPVPPPDHLEEVVKGVPLLVLLHQLGRLEPDDVKGVAVCGPGGFVVVVG